MKMYVIHVEDWKIGGDWSRNEIWTKNSLSGHGNFSYKFRKKNTGFKIWKRFDGGLKDPNIW